MQVQMTKDMAEMAGITLGTPAVAEPEEYCWTVSFSTRKKNGHLLVLENNKADFAAALCHVDQRSLKKTLAGIKDTILETMERLLVNPEIIRRYRDGLGEITFCESTPEQEERAGKSAEEIWEDIGCGNPAAFPYNRRLAAEEKTTFLPLVLAKQMDLPVYDYHAFTIEVTRFLVSGYPDRGEPKTLIVPGNLREDEFVRRIEAVTGTAGSRTYFEYKTENPSYPFHENPEDTVEKIFSLSTMAFFNCEITSSDDIEYVVGPVGDEEHCHANPWQ